MAYVYAVELENNESYRIQPLLYVTPTLTNNTYSASLQDFEIITGASIYVEIGITNPNSPLLNINNSGAKSIIYDGTPLPENTLQPGRIYNLVYNGVAWNITGELAAISVATDSKLGGVKTGYITDLAEKNYAVQLDNEQMYVHVPWDGASSWNAIQDKPTTLSGYGITDAYIQDNTVFLGDDSITFSIDNLGLEGVLHFIGMVDPSGEQPSDGVDCTPTIVGRSEYNPANGDVVLDKDGLREYVYANDVWVQLGFSASDIYDSDNITSDSEDVPTWISRITQATDGSIQVERQTMGVLPVDNGGTGASYFDVDQVILSSNPNVNEPMTLISRAYSDSSSAEALDNTSLNFVTERDIYFGLPTINDSHSYTSDDGIFAPTTSGEWHQLLVSDDTGNAPVWTPAAWLQSETSDISDIDAYTILTLGNSVDVTTAMAHSEGEIHLYSASNYAHILRGASADVTDYTHILPNSNGYLVQVPSAAAVGSNTNPIYIAANGVVTALTYTENRLYFSAATNSFEATNHYADADHIGLGAAAWPTDCEDTLYVTGTSTFNNDIRLLNHIYFGQPATSEDPQYYIDSSAVGFLSDLRVDNIQLDDDYIKFYQGINAGTSLYGAIQGTATRLIFNWATTDPLPAFEFNGDLLPSASDDPQVVYSLGADDSRWHHLFLKGDIYMQNLGTPEELATSNKIMWQSSYNNAEIYFAADPTVGASKLILNSSANTDSTIAIAFAGEDTAYINYSEPSFYPAMTNGGSLGTEDNTWAKLYIGTDPSHGDAYTPIYWNEGAPATVVPVQYCEFTIKESKGVMLTHEAFTENSYVLQIVVTSGESNLNSPIRWVSYSSGELALFCLTPPSGDVSGYILVSRGGSITPESEDFTGLPQPSVAPPVDPPSPPTPEPEGE